MIFPNGFCDFRRLRKELSMNDDPPTLYSFMESIVNYDKEESEKVKIKDLPIYAKDTIFNFTYPLSEYINKDEFEELFLKHYMFRRINFDTLTSFRIHLDVKLNSIMPKYNKMMDGFVTLNFLGDTETHIRSQSDSKTTQGNNTSNISTSTSDSTESENKYSDTPQNSIQDVKDGIYVSEFTDITNTSTGSSTSNSSSTNSSTDNGSLNERIDITRADSLDEYKKYLEVMNSIYEMIFKECDSLFYGVI